jgi:hypothetical protein
MINQPLKVNPTGEYKCRCVMRHVPEPQELHRHHVWPTGKGGPNIASNLLYLCPTTHSSAHKLWREYDRVGGEPLWEIRKNYGKYVRDIVARGWAQAHAS